MDPKLYIAAANIGRPTEQRSESLISYYLHSNGLAQVTCGQCNTALHIAAKHGNKSAVAYILRTRPSLASEPNAKGDTPLHTAARSGHTGIVALLVEHFCSAITFEAGNNCPLRLANSSKDTVLHEAVKNGRFCIAKMLVEKDPGLAALLNAAGESPLFMAADRGYYGTSLCLLRTFPCCSVFGRNGMTAMHAAVIRRDNFLVRKLLEICGPELLEIADDFGWMPLHYAASSGNVEAVEVILRSNSLLAYIKDSHGMSPIHIAAGNGRSRVVKRIAGERPDACELLDAGGRTALHVAVNKRREKVIKTLLETVTFDDLINERDFEGNTALHEAAIQVHFPILRMLAPEERVDTGILNNMGLTAFDIFCESITELTPIEKKFMLLLGRHYRIQSLRSTVAGESIPTPSDAEREREGPEETHSREANARSEESVNEKANSEREYVKNMSNINLVIATLIIGITFAAAVQVPGGYSDEGIANLKDKTSFTYFLVYDALAFGCAAGSLLTYFTSSIFSRMFRFLRPRHGSGTESLDIMVVMMFTALSITFSVAAFMYSTNAVLYRKSAPIFEISTYYLFWKLGLPATVAIISFYIPSGYLLYQLAPLIRLHFVGLLKRRARAEKRLAWELALPDECHPFSRV